MNTIVGCEKLTEIRPVKLNLRISTALLSGSLAVVLACGGDDSKPEPEPAAPSAGRPAAAEKPMDHGEPPKAPEPTAETVKPNAAGHGTKGRLPATTAGMMGA